MSHHLHVEEYYMKTIVSGRLAILGGDSQQFMFASDDQGSLGHDNSCSPPIRFTGSSKSQTAQLLFIPYK